MKPPGRPKRQQLLLTAKPVRHAPILASRFHMQEQPATVAVLGLSNKGICQRYCWYLLVLVRQIPTKIPTICWYG
jgi:hypothetical protein